MCNVSRPVLGTLLLALSMVAALILLFVGALVDKNWLTMIQLVPLLGAPIAVVVMNWASPDMETEDERALAIMNMGSCCVGMILSAFVGLPLVLLHTAALGEVGFWCWIGSTIVGFAGIGAYAKMSLGPAE